MLEIAQGFCVLGNVFAVISLRSKVSTRFSTYIQKTATKDHESPSKRLQNHENLRQFLKTHAGGRTPSTAATRSTLRCSSTATAEFGGTCARVPAPLGPHGPLPRRKREDTPHEARHFVTIADESCTSTREPDTPLAAARSARVPSRPAPRRRAPPGPRAPRT